MTQGQLSQQAIYVKTLGFPYPAPKSYASLPEKSMEQKKTEGKRGECAGCTGLCCLGGNFRSRYSLGRHRRSESLDILGKCRLATAEPLLAVYGSVQTTVI
jgi:hypothetical protein